jgi:hypothetical protein
MLKVDAGRSKTGRYEGKDVRAARFLSYFLGIPATPYIASDISRRCGTADAREARSAPSCASSTFNKRSTFETKADTAGSGGSAFVTRKGAKPAEGNGFGMSGLVDVLASLGDSSFNR